MPLDELGCPRYLDWYLFASTAQHDLLWHEKNIRINFNDCETEKIIKQIEFLALAMATSLCMSVYVCVCVDRWQQLTRNILLKRIREKDVKLNLFHLIFVRIFFFEFSIEFGYRRASKSVFVRFVCVCVWLFFVLFSVTSVCCWNLKIILRSSSLYTYEWSLHKQRTGGR